MSSGFRVKSLHTHGIACRSHSSAVQSRKEVSVCPKTHDVCREDLAAKLGEV